MKKKIFSILLIIAVLLSMIPTSAFADSVVYIGTLEELNNFANMINRGNYNDRLKSAILTADIGSPENPFTNRIGRDNASYCGTFDGQGHTVYISSDFTGESNEDLRNKVGLFGMTNEAQIKNVIVKGSVKGADEVGGIVGDATNNTKVINCENYCSVSGSWYVGGIAGYVSEGSTIENCAHYGSVSGDKYKSYIFGAYGYSNSSYNPPNCFFNNIKSVQDLNNGLKEGYISWMTGPNGKPVHDFSKLTGSFISVGNIAIVSAIVIVIAGAVVIFVKKKKVSQN